VSAGVQQVQVIIICRSTSWICPEQIHSITAVLQNQVVIGYAEAVNLSTESRQRLTAVHEIALPRARSAVFSSSGITGRGNIQRPIRGHGIHRLRDNAILKRRFTEIKNVVHDDLAAVAAQIQNILRKTGIADNPRRKVKLRFRREVVNNLQHRRTLADADSSLSRQNRDVTEIPITLREQKALYAVGQHSDR